MNNDIPVIERYIDNIPLSSKGTPMYISYIFNTHIKVL